MIAAVVVCSLVIRVKLMSLPCCVYFLGRKLTHRFNHLVELGFDLGLEVGLDRVDIDRVAEQSAVV